MPKPTLQNRSHFKTWLRYFRDKFTSNIQVAPEFYIDDILTSKASGISTTDNVNILIVNNRENISITTAFNNDELIYIPALSGDTINVGIGTSTLALKFGDEGSSITYDNVSYGLNDTIAISSTRSLTIKGLGGLLLQGGSTPTYSVTPSALTVNEGSSVIEGTAIPIRISVGITVHRTSALVEWENLAGWAPLLLRNLAME